MRNLIPKLSETLKKLLGVGLLKTSFNTDFWISGLKVIPFLDCVQEVRVCKIFCSARHM